MGYPLVKQDGVKDCGPCSLAAIIIYYKGYLSVNALQDMMHTTRNGTTAYNIIETARKLGFESHGLKIDNLDNITLPAIAFVTISKYYNHYIVIYKIDKKNNRILIGDPATKVKYISNDEFNKIWNNIVITLKPNKTLPYIKEKTLPKYIIDIICSYKLYLVILVLISFLFIILSLGYSLFIKYIIDNIDSLTKNILILLIITFIFKIIINYIKNIMTINLNKKISISLTNKINNSLISLPYIYYRNHTTGEIVSRFNDVESIKDIISNFISLLVEIPFIISFIILLYFLNNTLLFYVVILLMIYIILNLFILHFIKNNINLYQENKSRFNSLLVESLNGFETIKGLNIEKKIINKIDNSYVKLEDTIYKYQKIYNLKNVLSDILINITSLIIIITGFILYKNNDITLGTLMSFYVIYNYLIEPINDILDFCIKYKEASNSSRRIQEISYEDNMINQDLYGDIIYKNLNYKVGLNVILKNINLKIKKGEKVIITGPSGSGKSTIVKLLKGYYKTDDIYINNNMHHKGENIIYISQNEILFTDTIYGNLMCDDSRVDEVVKTCLIDKDLNMFIEENGFNLSGGEKEKIILARSLLREFDILIIDEGLSAIDVNNERIILKNIFKKYKDKTIIIITHRLDNLDLYNHFIEVNNGMIIKDEVRNN